MATTAEKRSYVQAGFVGKTRGQLLLQLEDANARGRRQLEPKAQLKGAEPIATRWKNGGHQGRIG